MGVKRQTIQGALQRVADNPEVTTDDMVSLPVHELVARTLFEIANTADTSRRGSLVQANVARKMIFDRLVGKRRSGSHPATRERKQLKFADLTGEVEK